MPGGRARLQRRAIHTHLVTLSRSGTVHAALSDTLRTIGATLIHFSPCPVSARVQIARFADMVSHCSGQAPSSRSDDVWAATPAPRFLEGAATYLTACKCRYCLRGSWTLEMGQSGLRSPYDIRVNSEHVSRSCICLQTRNVYNTRPAGGKCASPVAVSQ